MSVIALSVARDVAKKWKFTGDLNDETAASAIASFRNLSVGCTFFSTIRLLHDWRVTAGYVP